MKPRSKQHAYNQLKEYFSRAGAELAAVTGVDEHGFESVDCLYRTPEGRACAVGCLIPDSKYNEEFENNRASAVIQTVWPDLYRDPVSDSGYRGSVAEFLDMAQSCHDGANSVGTFLAELRLLAENQGLKA